MSQHVLIGQDYREKAFVIHLERIAERRQWMDRQMEVSGFDWSYWSATDSRAFSRADYAGWFGGRYLECPWLTKALGTWACAISHVRLWHALLAVPPKSGTAFVFEDDVQVQPSMAQRWPELVRELPEDWDFVFFNPWDERCIDPRGRHSEHFHRLIRVEATPSTTGYAVNVRRLSVNLPRILPLYEEIDFHLSRRLAVLKLFIYGHADWLVRSDTGFASVREG